MKDFSADNLSYDQKAVLSHWFSTIGIAACKAYEERVKKFLPPKLLASLKSVRQRRQPMVKETMEQVFFPGFLDDIPFPPLCDSDFTFIDLFAGIGGFHQAMERLGGRCVFASEWDDHAQRTYARNYGMLPFGDITKIDEHDVPDHDVLCAGFPCQPFSKAGKQLGFEDETKGTLFFDIKRILRSKIDNGHPTRYIVLENVRNLVSHDSGKTWKTISSNLRSLGYRLTPEPLIVSPHYFGIPQLRERVLILGVYEPHNVDAPLTVKLPRFMRKEDCDVHEILEDGAVAPAYYLTAREISEIDMWDEFYRGIKETVLGFPVWAECFLAPPDGGMPEWKQEFVRKNNALYRNNKRFIDGWLRRHNNLEDVTPTMRKLEWQVGDNAESLWDCLMQKRPSGLRVKRADCAPALVAIVQVPIIGPCRRRMTVREAARLQSFPDDFIPNPVMHEAYKQFGNAVNVEVVRICSASLFRHGEQPIIFE